MRAEPFALFVGIAYASLGLLGLLPAALTPPSGYLLDVLPVNGPLSGLHIALGAWGITAWRRLTSPIWFARALAVIASCLAVIGLVPGAWDLTVSNPDAQTAGLSAGFVWSGAPELTQARRWLAEAAEVGLAIGLDLLGVSAPEQL